MKKINIRGWETYTLVEFDMLANGKYWIQNFWGCQVRMEKSDDPVGWGDKWFVEVYLKTGESDDSWVSMTSFQPRMRDCVDYLMRIANASKDGKQITFRHSVMHDSEGMWAWRALRTPFKTVLQPTRRKVPREFKQSTQRRVNNGV